MSAYLEEFEGLYSEKADAAIEKATGRIAKKQADVDRLNELYPQLLEMFTELGKGETFTKFYPGDGTFNGGNPILGLDPEYTALYDYGDEYKKGLNELYKIRDANQDLERATKQLEKENNRKSKGAAEYAKGVRQAIASMMATIPNPNRAWKMLEESYDNFDDLSMQLDDQKDADGNYLVDGPRGVVSSPALYNYIIEQGNPFDDASAINSESAKEVEREGNALNAEELGENESVPTEESGPLNDDSNEEIESNEEISKVESGQPELEQEVVIPAQESEQSDNFTEIEQVSPINEEATTETFDTDSDGSITINEYNETQGDVFNNIVENVQNETSNITEQVEAAQSSLNDVEEKYIEPAKSPIESENTTIDSDQGYIEPEVNESSNTASINNIDQSSNNQINPSEEANLTTNTSLVDTTAISNAFGLSQEEQNFLNEMIGGTSNTQESTSVSSSNTSINNDISSGDVISAINNDISSGDVISAINTSTKLESQSNTINESTSEGEKVDSRVSTITNAFGLSQEEQNFLNEMISDSSSTTNVESVASEMTEVTKNAIGLDKKIAPINEPAKTENSTESKETVSVNEISKTESNKEINTNDKETKSVSSTSETSIESKSEQSPMYQNIDMSGLERRLRKIENLLTGPLEVKIVE